MYPEKYGEFTLKKRCNFTKFYWYFFHRCSTYTGKKLKKTLQICKTWKLTNCYFTVFSWCPRCGKLPFLSGLFYDTFFALLLWEITLTSLKIYCILVYCWNYVLSIKIVNMNAIYSNIALNLCSCLFTCFYDLLKVSALLVLS